MHGMEHIKYKRPANVEKQRGFNLYDAKRHSQGAVGTKRTWSTQPAHFYHKKHLTSLFLEPNSEFSIFQPCHPRLSCEPVWQG
jgi:hypothetical protein